MKKRIWIVGGSSGIGLELVKKWLERGNSVIASAQNASHTKELLALKLIYEKELQIIDVDVTSQESVTKAVHQAWKRFDGLDIWFYNAAVYEVMSIKEWKVEHFEAMMQVNYLGVVRVMTELIPYFEAQKSGRWIWNSSLSSYFGLPLGGGYSAPKAAMLNLAEALQPELKGKGIELQIINHGFVKTKLTEKNTFEMPELMSPEDAAQNIIDNIGKKYHFEIHFPFKLSTFLQTLRIIPYKLALTLTKKMLPK
ncbi:MAG: Short-chain dehydrogenase/reductase SDR [uncultured Sulfurovum sp.]|uniref:Short-chain dehydrogenase/reductase SDR n=1 Tax=uncultured Sulfurovum sp. TaxID=269237 RepID=A0A6S6TRL0_9BACT|nr:MAG: Short-chain dehydrogenase/reductase SDR [uncultured Sulfurovum sp.]